jgi:hypothetical protein
MVVRFARKVHVAAILEIVTRCGGPICEHEGFSPSRSLSLKIGVSPPQIQLLVRRTKGESPRMAGSAELPECYGALESLPLNSGESHHNMLLAVVWPRRRTTGFSATDAGTRERVALSLGVERSCIQVGWFQVHKGVTGTNRVTTTPVSDW